MQNATYINGQSRKCELRIERCDKLVEDLQKRRTALMSNNCKARRCEIRLTRCDRLVRKMQRRRRRRERMIRRVERRWCEIRLERCDQMVEELEKRRISNSNQTIKRSTRHDATVPVIRLERCDRLIKKLKRRKRRVHLTEFKCQYCKIIFSTIKGLDNHLSDEKKCIVRKGLVPAECIIEKFNKTEKGKLSFLQKLKSRQFKCRFCAKKFHIWHMWNNHERNSHHRDGPTRKKKDKKFKCFICIEHWEDYDDLSSLKFHLQEDHSFSMRYGRLYVKINNDDCFKCDHCSETFTVASKQQLVRHLAKVHFSDGLKHQCKICSKRYKTVKLLKKHIKMIHSMKLYNCEFCSKTFKKKSDLRHHMKGGFHKEQLNREKCKICSSRLHALNKHLNHAKCAADESRNNELVCFESQPEL